MLRARLTPAIFISLAMRSLAAAISPGYFGFTDWAFAAEAASEIAVQVPIATRKNNALIIVCSRSFILANARSIL